MALLWSWPGEIGPRLMGGIPIDGEMAFDGELLARAADEFPVGVMLLTVEDEDVLRLALINRVGCEASGLSPDATGRRMDELLPELHATGIAQVVLGIVETGEAVDLGVMDVIDGQGKPGRFRAIVHPLSTTASPGYLRAARRRGGTAHTQPESLRRRRDRVPTRRDDRDLGGDRDPALRHWPGDGGRPTAHRDPGSCRFPGRAGRTPAGLCPGDISGRSSRNTAVPRVTRSTWR